jgi:hypothetical protein
MFRWGGIPLVTCLSATFWPPGGMAGIAGPGLILRQAKFDGLGAVGGVSALAASGAGKLPLAPANSHLTEH